MWILLNYDSRGGGPRGQYEWILISDLFQQNKSIELKINLAYLRPMQVYYYSHTILSSKLRIFRHRKFVSGRLTNYQGILTFRCPLTILADFLVNCTSLIAFQSCSDRKSSDMADVNIVGVVSIVVFYMLILGIGLWAAWRRKEGEEEAMLAGRSIGMVVGTFTLTGNSKM